MSEYRFAEGWDWQSPDPVSVAMDTEGAEGRSAEAMLTDYLDEKEPNWDQVLRGRP